MVLSLMVVVCGVLMVFDDIDAVVEVVVLLLVV